jgi:hypothetical protein
MTTNAFLRDLNCVTDEAATTKPHKLVAVLLLLCVLKQASTPTSLGLISEKRAI